MPRRPRGIVVMALSEEQLIASLDEEIIEKLRAYDALLHKWQKSINLVGPKTLAESWRRHFLDSLQLLPHLPEGVKTLYDLGCGAGFPGLVVAMARPEYEVHLIESDQRKCSFLRAVSRETNTPVHIHNTRIESAERPAPAPDIVTARALASLKDLCAYTLLWAEAEPNLQMYFPKGAQFGGELIEAQACYSFSYDVYDAPLLDSDSVIIKLSNLCKSDSE